MTGSPVFAKTGECRGKGEGIVEGLWRRDLINARRSPMLSTRRRSPRSADTYTVLFIKLSVTPALNSCGLLRWLYSESRSSVRSNGERSGKASGSRFDFNAGLLDLFALRFRPHRLPHSLHRPRRLRARRETVRHTEPFAPRAECWDTPLAWRPCLYITSPFRTERLLGVRPSVPLRQPNLLAIVVWGWYASLLAGSLVRLPAPRREKPTRICLNRECELALLT